MRPLCRPPRQQPTFECFHPLMRCHLFPSPSDLVYTYRHTPRSTRRGISRVPHFYLWRHPVCIRIDSVIYFAVDGAGPLYNTTREGEFRRPRFDHHLFASTLRATKRLRVIISRVYFARLVDSIRARTLSFNPRRGNSRRVK